MSKSKKEIKKGVLSTAIDPFLLEGGHRPVEIANTLVEKFDGAFSKEKIVNNIRSRIVFLTSKKGYKVVKTGKHIQLVKDVSPTLQLNASESNTSGDAVHAESSPSSETV